MKFMKEVLIAEHDEIIAHLLESILSGKDYVITGKVATGEEASSWMLRSPVS